MCCDHKTEQADSIVHDYNYYSISFTIQGISFALSIIHVVVLFGDE